MKKQFTFIESMIKVGVIGFGGGNALIPVLEQEVVNEKKLVSKDEYDKSVIAATLTPGLKLHRGLVCMSAASVGCSRAVY
jgi:chromate transporter